MILWRETALKLGAKSSLSSPFSIFGEMVGSLAIYSDEQFFFNQDEVSLLEEMTDNISFALENIEKEVERKQMAMSLLESEQFKNQIIQSVNEGVIVYDLDLRYMVWNPFMEKLTGIPSSEILGKTCLLYTSPSPRDGLLS